MKSRLFVYDTDYELVSGWWKKREHIVIQKDFLSDFGVLVEDDNGKKLAVMWLYPLLSTKWCMIRFPITNPDSTKEERNKALDLVFDNLHGMAMDMGYKYLFCTTNHSALIERLKKYNYTQDASDCVHFWGGV
jgi:hypothetical protein